MYLKWIFIISLIYMSACCTCRTQNQYGVCVECERCTRHFSNIKIEGKLTEVPNFSLKILEQRDPVFAWEKVQIAFLNGRQSIGKALQEYNTWSKRYSSCAISDEQWFAYLNNLQNNTIYFLKAKKILMERIGFILVQINLDRATDLKFQSALQYIYEIDCYEMVLLVAVESLQNTKLYSSVEYQKQVKKLKEECEEVFQKARRFREGKISMGSDTLIRNLEAIEKNLKN